MKKPMGFLLLALCANIAALPAQDAASQARHAASVTITRDDWGIAHIRGKTDADAVFGMIYAQAEDDFNRVETNYLTALGRTAEAEGESAIWQDLRQKLFIDPDTLKREYAVSPAWLKALMNAWADGLNFYLAKHPEVKPRVITHFEPWMALSFTEGSIGGDIERINTGQLAAFYGGVPAPAGRRGGGDEPAPVEDGVLREPTGSNGIAIAPANTADHHALLYINPHTSFFFRSELQMTSDEGLNAYGAVTWGQFFIYQGFNATAGWMHTSSGVDNIDEFLETVTQRDGKWSYRHGADDLPGRLANDHAAVSHVRGDGSGRRFTAYFTRHGPVVRKDGDKWVSVSLMNSPVNALIQSYRRTKAQDYAGYVKVMDLHTNSSNNTLFADAKGERRLPALQLHPEARHLASTGPARSTAAIRPRTITACCPWPRRRTSSTRERLRLQLEQLALVGGRPGHPEARRLPAVRRNGTARIAARRSRPQGAAGTEGLHDDLAHPRGRLRQLPAVVREADAGADQGVGR